LARLKRTYNQVLSQIQYWLLVLISLKCWKHWASIVCKCVLWNFH
jgi:hypothetical protein